MGGGSLPRGLIDPALVLRRSDDMAGTADAAKNALSSIFDKTKDVLSTAAETTKGYASQAQHAIGKIIPGASQDQDTNAVPTSGDATAPTAGAPAQSQ